MASHMPSVRSSDPVSATALLSRARELLSQQDLARRLDVSRRTIARWQNGETECPAMVGPALREIIHASSKNGNAAGAFTFIDLFAGIGGMRAGFEQAGGTCVFTSEWNQWANKTYVANYGFDEERFRGDIVPVPADDIPDHDVLLAGFPCQPFSIAGVSKKNALGRPHGFECTTQGTLFFDVARIISKKRPKAFLLENVKNLVSHDGGNTFRVIRDELKKLDYYVETRVIDGGHFVPQHRERILIVGFREPVGFRFDHLQLPAQGPRLASILHPEDGSEPAEEPYTTGPLARVHAKYVLSDKLWAYLQAYAEKHRKAGNGFGFGLVDKNSVARTLSARYYKDGSEILISRGKGKNPRRLTPRECARLMGFSDSFKIPVSDTQAYKQFGNSVVVPVIRAVAQMMEPYIRTLKRYEETGALELPLFG